MLTNKQVRKILTQVAKKKYKKSYGRITTKQQKAVRVWIVKKLKKAN